MSDTLKRKKAVSTANTTSGGIDVPRKVLRPNDDSSASTTLEKDESAAKIQQNRQKQKILQTHDNLRLLLLPESQGNTNDKDRIFAQNFIDKVNEIYLAEENSNKPTEFIQILQDFDHANGKAAELYQKMENFFLPDHPELAELFLAFLTPGEAAQVGKFMEHFMLTNMTNFINKLSIFCSKKPVQMRKILNCLTELSNKSDVQMHQLCSAVLPLLKGNPLMIKWFMQCFPSDDSLLDGTADIDREFESLNFYNASKIMDDTDIYEHIPQSEILPDPIDNPCHIRYQNGHIYYGSKISLPIKLSFMPTHAEYNVDDNESPEPIENCISSDKAIELEQLQYRCVHAIKPYGDHVLREQRGNELNISDLRSGNSDGQFSTAVCDPSTLPSCCDNMTLKAHATRLYPNANSTQLIKNSELLDRLKSGSASERLSDTQKEGLRITPKTQYTPNANKLTNLSSSSNDQALSDTIDEYDDWPESEDDDAQKEDDTDDEEEDTDLLSFWSREEDKVLLEHIKMCRIPEDDLMLKLQAEHLPNRELQEIYDRFTFLMDIIVNM